MRKLVKKAFEKNRVRKCLYRLRKKKVRRREGQNFQGSKVKWGLGEALLFIKKVGSVNIFMVVLILIPFPS